LSVQGDAYAIFGGGRTIPEDYHGVLYQGNRGVGKLSPGTYNAAIILQSLANYDGSDSTLYLTRRGPFHVPLVLEGLPDPGDLSAKLTARLTLAFEVVDPVAVIT